MTIFLTTHYMEEAAKCSHIAVMDAGKIREFGTPFSLKEKYSRDRLTLMAKSQTGELLESKFQGERIRWEKGSEEGLYNIYLQDSMAAIPVLKETAEFLEGFELVHGSMDDVFLNITGKKLGEQK